MTPTELAALHARNEQQRLANQHAEALSRAPRPDPGADTAHLTARLGALTQSVIATSLWLGPLEGPRSVIDEVLWPEQGEADRAAA